jgi:hypothetical protein
MRGPGDVGAPQDGTVEPVDADSVVPWYPERLVPVRPGLWASSAPTPGRDGTYLENPGVRYDLIVSLTSWGSDSPDGALRETGRFVWLPMVDGHEIPEAEVRLLAAEIAEAVRSGREVLVHCDAGLNRTGVVVARTLLELGEPIEAAVAAIRASRGPVALCNGWFVTWLHDEARRIGERAVGR